MLYNLGCLYEKQKKYTESFQCFNHLSKINPSMSEAYYGIALCSLRLKNYEQTLKAIDKALLLEKDNNKKIRSFKYLKAIYYKQIGKFEESTSIYFALFKRFPQHINHPNYLLYEKCYVPEDGWKIDKKREIYSKLEHISFFKRFTRTDIEQIFKLMKIKIQSNNILLFPKEDEVIVILQGKISIYSHEKDLENPEIIADYGPGSIISNLDIDNGVCKESENWIISETNLELCIFTKEKFNVNNIINK